MRNNNKNFLEKFLTGIQLFILQGGLVVIGVRIICLLV